MAIKIEIKMVNYIAHPYWPARDKCIEVEKKSGVNRQKSDEKRVAALKAECIKQNITYDQYLAMKEEAKKQWYQNNGNNIYIPRHQIAGACVEAIGSSPKALRGMFDKDNFRALVQIGDFVTDQKKSSGIFSRFVKLESSNQRSWQENEFIGQYLNQGEPFTAEGVLCLTDPKQDSVVKQIMTRAIEEIGVGAARKMGFGRGKIVKWESN